MLLTYTAVGISCMAVCLPVDRNDVGRATCHFSILLRHILHSLTGSCDLNTENCYCVDSVTRVRTVFGSRYMSGPHDKLHHVAAPCHMLHHVAWCV